MEDSLARKELTLEEVRGLSSKHEKFFGFSHAGMFLAGNDDMIGTRLHYGYPYEEATRELWRKLCKDAYLVADVGTHSGIFTLDAYRAGAENVLSCEPHPINYSRMVLNLRLNGFPYHGAHYVALGDEDKTSYLLVKSGLYYCAASGRMEKKNANGMEIPVRLRRMDSLILKEHWHHLKAVKIDAENFTPHVLCGMSKILAEHKPDIILECTEFGMTEILKPKGYRFWKIWETGEIKEVEDLTPYNPENNYNGTDEDCRNRFASVRGLPSG